MDNRTEEIVFKYLSEECLSSREYYVLNKWLSDYNNRQYFNELRLVKQRFAVESHIQEVNDLRVWKRIEKRISTKNLRIRRYSYYVASILIPILIFLTFYLVKSNGDTKRYGFADKITELTNYFTNDLGIDDS